MLEQAFPMSSTKTLTASQHLPQQQRGLFFILYIAFIAGSQVDSNLTLTLSQQKKEMMGTTLCITHIMSPYTFWFVVWWIHSRDWWTCIRPWLTGASFYFNLLIQIFYEAKTTTTVDAAYEGWNGFNLWIVQTSMPFDEPLNIEIIFTIWPKTIHWIPDLS